MCVCVCVCVGVVEQVSTLSSLYPSRRSTLTSQQLALGGRRKSIGVKRDGKEFWETRTTYRRGITPDSLRPYAVSTLLSPASISRTRTALGAPAPCHVRKRHAFASPAMEHWGTCLLDFQQSIFSVHLRAAQSLTASLCGCLSKHICSLYYLMLF